MADWTPRIGKYVDQHPELFAEGPQWWDNRKEAAPAGFDVATQSTSQSDNLNWQQRQLYDTVLQHYDQHLAFERGEGPAPRQLLINVDGSAGTGKSYVIKLISAHLQAAARNHGLASPVLRLAPTGSAAFNIEGSTIHSALKIPVGSKFGAPTDAQRTGLQNAFRPIRYIVIDEKSMVSLQLMGQIDQRLRSAAFERPDAAKYFGGMNILLCGDFYQLTPVAATPLFTPEPKKLEDISGRSAYCAFDTTVTLSTIVRQQGGDQEAFRQALEALRHGTVGKAHWDTLMTRTKYKLTPGEIDSFRDAVHLFFANKFVKEHNHERLRDTGSPVIAINAVHDTPVAANVDADKFQNLQAVLRVSIGCRVMLLTNLWTEHGLVNGRQGDLVDIIWPVELDGDPRDSLPLFMLVAFDDLPADAPEVYRNNGKKVVPIWPARRDAYVNSRTAWRRQFPLTVSYALSVHKAQGMSLDRVVLNLGHKEHSPGLCYVAVSRARRLQGVMLQETVDLSRLQRIGGGPVHRQRQADYERRQPQHLCKSASPQLLDR